MLAMLACMIGGILALTQGALESSYAGIGFLALIPFALGALATGSGLGFYNSAGCIIAPVVLFAAIFPLVHYGFAEGLVCILMALPFWLAAGLGGGLASYIAHRRMARDSIAKGSTKIRVSALLALPFAVLLAEELNPAAWQERSVVRSVDIAAAPHEVWPLLLSIPGVTPDEGRATFTHDIAGIPRPSEALLEQRGEVLVRAARWGENIRFEERVTQLDPGRAIGWDFAFPDSSVQDYTDRHISPDGPLLKIASGGYRIEALGKGRARVTLTTTYRMRSRLGWYLALWGEVLLGDVQDNVLTIIKTRAEA